MTNHGRKLGAAALLILGVSACEQRSAEPANQDNGSTAAAPAAASASESPLAKRATDQSLQWGACPPAFPQGCEIAVLHGDPAKPNADVFFRVPAGYEIPPHSHTSAERMILVSGALDVKYRGAPQTALQTGSYAYGPAGLPHRATCRSAEPCTLFIAFEGPVDVQPFAGDLG